MLTFDALAARNLERNFSGFNNMLERKDLSFFGNALAGETGEACNIIKKIERGDFDNDPSALANAIKSLAKELADIVTYADLIATKIGYPLGRVVKDKFNEVSKRIGSDVRL